MLGIPEKLNALVSELRHRRVFRVAAIYGVAAWVFIEVTSTIFSILLLPAWLMRVVVVCAVLGFPLALALSWAFDITPELSQIELLSVVSRNGVKPFRDGTTSFDAMVRKLGVGSLVEGSVEQFGDRLVATVQLVDGRTGLHHFTEQIESLDSMSNDI